jgi:sugar/nucleoside kinase (ribokinase family)
MTQYDVYGLGNALLDIECEVSTDLLQSLGIDKGVMTLIDEASENQILNQLTSLPKKRTCGGSAANTVIAISQFGGKAFYSCKVANDEPGQFYFQDLRDCGVATNLEMHEPEVGTTGKCLVFVTPDADRTMNTFLGISANFSETELVPDAIANAKYTYIEGYLVTGDPSKRAAIRAKEIAQAAGRNVAFSLSDFNMVKYFKDGLLEIIGSGIDFLFANESEALQMADTTDINVAIDCLKTLSKSFAITRGPNGSVIFDGDRMIEIEPFPVHAIDTVGAGDMYAGAVLYGITNHMSLADAGRLGSMASAKLVTTLGPRLQTEQSRSLLEHF